MGNEAVGHRVSDWMDNETGTVQEVHGNAAVILWNDGSTSWTQDYRLDLLD